MVGVQSDTGASKSLSGTCSVNSSRGRWVLAATLLASAASFILGSAVSVALPTIQSVFDTNISGLQWVVNSYLLALSAFLLVGGSLGDHFGRKRIFMVGMAVFVAGAFLSGLAWSIGALTAFQAIEGLGSALMVPQSLAIINSCFRSEERGRAIGLWAGISGGIAAFGPWLGGILVESFGWNAVFWMPLPIIALALGITVHHVPENRDVETGSLDWPGTSLVLLALLGLTYALVSGPIRGWDAPVVAASLLAGVCGLGAFILVEARSSAPLVHLEIFRNPLVSGANVATLFLYFALSGILLFTVLNLQQIQGYTPTQAGVRMLPPVIIITLLAAPAGMLADKFGPRGQMIAGPALVALGAALLMLAGSDADYLTYFLPGLASTGTGMALVIAPLTKSALSVDMRFSGSASGVNNAVARAASLMAVAVLGAVMIATFTPELSDALEASALTPEQQLAILQQYDKLGGITVPQGFSDSARVIAEIAVRHSFVHAYRWAMGVCAMLALAASTVSFFTIHPAKSPVVRSGARRP